MELSLLDGIYCMATGFVIAFLFTVVHHLATGKAMAFALGDHGSAPLALASIFVRLIAGPALLAQHALESAAKGRHAIGAAGLPLACLWSLGLGWLIIDSVTQLPALPL
jgi:hypothetical protein